MFAGNDQAEQKNGDKVTSTDTVPEIDAGPRLRIDGTRPLSPELVSEVQMFIDQAVSRTGVPVIHLSGAPSAAPGEIGIQLVSKWERALRHLERLDTPTIAVAQGDCGGVALETLLCTDYRLATGDLRLLVTTGTDAGATWPGMGLYRLANQVGVGRVRRAVLFGTPIPVAEAKALNLIDEIVADPTDAIAAADTLAAARSGAELAIARQLLFDATTTSFEEALGRHLAACDRRLRRARNGDGIDR